MLTHTARIAGDSMSTHPACFLPIVLLLTASALAQSTPAQGPLEITSLLGRKLYAQADDGSIAAARQKLSSGPSTAALYVALSKAEAGRRQYQEAVKTDTRGLAQFPGDADLLLERGHRELGLREFAEAHNDLAHAVQIDPSKLEAHYHLGLAYYFQGPVCGGCRALPARARSGQR